EQAQVEALAAEFAVTFISLKPGEIDAAILAALEQAATALKAERAALFRFVEDGMVVRPAHTWMATGEREMGGEEFPVTLMPWLKRQLEAGRLLAVSSRADLPEEASRELAQMERDGVHSFVAAPLRYAGALIGYLRFDLTAADAMLSSPQASLVERTAQIFANVLERKRMENQLIASKEAAEEAARIKSSFLANMSHEIRTPLTSIIGFAGLLAEEVETEQEQEYVSLIQDSGTRLMETLNSVLDLAQLEAAGRSVNLSVFDLNQQVEDVVRLLRPLADAKGLTLEAVPSEMPARAEVDHACLLRILNNLIGNAIKFTSKGGVSVEVVADGQQVSIHVRDTGIGIDEAFLPRLFDPFRQESGGLNRQYEGSGLGLTISKRLIDLMGGTIEVTSEKSVGSTFTISFAQVRPYVPDADLPEPAFVYEPDESSGAPSKLLVVEDNRETRILFQHMLRGRYDVDAVDRAEEAIRRASMQRYDAILMDINLGGKQTGIDVLRILRQVGGYDTTPIVALTAHALPGDRERFLRMGFDGYVSKPFSRNDLTHTLGRLIQV
ncbi:MAG: ATP-binding protein, partial [Bacteroidota bacterium]